MRWWLLLVPVAYLVGTFPSARIVAQAAGVDIHSAGSGNPGASNVSRTLGWRKGLVVFGLDAAKGVIATLIGLWVGGRAGGYVLGIAAVVGHIFPATHRFRGGKGVASSAGVVLVLHPLVFAVEIVIWLAVSRLWHKAAIASLVVVVTTPVGVGLTGRPAWEVLATAALAVVLIARHAGNIQRLVRRREHDLESARS